MRLYHISIGNLRRRKGKMILLSIGLSIGIAVVIAMIGITSKMKADVEKKLDEYGANIIVYPKSKGLSLNYGGLHIADTSYDIEELRNADAILIRGIKNTANISAVAPKIIGTYKSNARSYLLVGVDFPSELMLKKWWKWSGKTPDSKNDILLGAMIAKNLNLNPGSILLLGGQDYRVVGVLNENASQDDFSVFLHLETAQQLLRRPDKLSMIEVSALCSACPIDDIVAQISEKLPYARVSPVRQAVALRMQTVEQLMKFSAAISVVIIIIGALIVLISMLSSVNERTKEIGILRAIGFRQWHVVKVILFEAFVVSVFSGITGWVMGSVSISLLLPVVTGTGGFLFDPFLLALAAGIAVCTGMLSSIYPAVKASRLEPLEALRYI
ncbi:MAG: ABC transporter permease [Nitrospirota bacterium]